MLRFLPYCDIRHIQAAELSALRAGRTLSQGNSLVHASVTA